jgi:hypothetical protein
MPGTNSNRQRRKSERLQEIGAQIKFCAVNGATRSWPAFCEIAPPEMPAETDGNGTHQGPASFQQHLLIPFQRRCISAAWKVFRSMGEP